MKDRDAEREDQGDLDDQEHEARQDLGEQVVGLAHGGRDHQLQGFLQPRVDDRKADAPDPGSHEVQAQDARQEEINVARAFLVNSNLARGRRVAPSPRALDRVVDLQPRDAGVRPGGIEAVDEIARLRLLDEKRDFPGAKSFESFRHSGVGPRSHGAGLRQGLRDLLGRPARDDADREGIGKPVAKREAEDDRHDDGKGEDPEEGLGLADELEQARLRQREQRVTPLTHRAAPAPSGR